jgi:hypothetical protein
VILRTEESEEKSGKGIQRKEIDKEVRMDLKDRECLFSTPL